MRLMFAFGVLIGTCLSLYFNLQPVIVYWSIGAVIICLLGLFSKFFFPKACFKSDLQQSSCTVIAILPVVSGGLLGLAFGLINSHFQGATPLAWTLPTSHYKQDVVLTGKIADIPKVRSKYTQFELTEVRFDADMLTPPLAAKFKLSWYGKAPILNPGEVWQFTARLNPPHGMLNEGGYDYERQLYLKNIRATGYINTKKPYRLIGQSQTFNLDAYRYHYWQQLKMYYQDYPYNGLMSALLFGIKHDIKPWHWDVLQQTGTSHLMAISGLHIGLVAGFVFLIVNWLWRLVPSLGRSVTPQQAAGVCSVLAALFYSALAGFSLPTIRACMMVGLLMAVLVFNRSRQLVDVYALVLLSVLLMMPLSVLSYGFWLSFGAVGVLLFTMQHRKQTKGLYWSFVRAQWVMFVAFIPVLLLFFSSVAWSSPAANILAVPWFSIVVVPLLMIGLVSAWVFEPLALWVFSVAHTSIEWCWWYLSTLTSALSPFNTKIAVSGLAVASGVLGVFIILLPRGWPGRYIGWFFLLAMLFWPKQKPGDDELWMHVLDVGQGLATVLQTKDKVLIYDTGPSFPGSDSGERVILPFLSHYGINKIDTMVVSHADDDHRGGAKTVARGVQVDSILSGTPSRLRFAKVDACEAGQSWYWGEIEFEMLHPSASLNKRKLGKRTNNRSCVLRIKIGDTRILITGDIEKRVEKQLVKRYPELLDVDILFASHHGSKTSSIVPFVATTNPQHVIYAAGFLNRFKFPKPEIMARFEALGATSHNTGTDGQVTFKIHKRFGVTEIIHHRTQSNALWRTHHTRS